MRKQMLLRSKKRNITRNIKLVYQEASIAGQESLEHVTNVIKGYDNVMAESSMFEVSKSSGPYLIYLHQLICSLDEWVIINDHIKDRQDALKRIGVYRSIMSDYKFKMELTKYDKEAYQLLEDHIHEAFLEDSSWVETVADDINLIEDAYQLEKVVDSNILHLKHVIAIDLGYKGKREEDEIQEFLNGFEQISTSCPVILSRRYDGDLRELHYIYKDFPISDYTIKELEYHVSKEFGEEIEVTIATTS